VCAANLWIILIYPSCSTRYVGYWGYQEDDLHDYSTYLYTDKAVSIIEESDSDTPFFLYLSFQAVHDPYTDAGQYSSGVPTGYLSDTMYNDVRKCLLKDVHTCLYTQVSSRFVSGPSSDRNALLWATLLCLLPQIMDNVVGRKRRQYAMHLALLDDAVSSIQTALDDKGILDNTYIIFTSDNGGCYMSGGRNGPLRGTKGSLFEGKYANELFEPSGATSCVNNTTHF
jgi:membrane-anchored protein YejM (alkaline phosphatase superfamily)